MKKKLVLSLVASVAVTLVLGYGIRHTMGDIIVDHQLLSSVSISVDMQREIK